MCKKICALLLSIVILASGLAVFAAAEETGTTLSTAADMLEFVIVEKSVTIPVRIVPAVLTENGEDRPVYLIGMLGVKNVKGQVNSVLNCLFAAFNKKNTYYTLVKDTILAEIPAGSSLVFACHSLGGMVAQQLRTDEDLQARYEILNVLTAGSPYIMVSRDGEGALHRLIDKNDAVPFLSPATVLKPDKQFRECAREDGGYTMDPDSAHNLSYLRDDLWGAYDVFGERDGGRTIRFDPAAMKIFGVVENGGRKPC